MGALGYDGSLEASQPFAVAENMKWLVAGLYTFSAVVMFISIALIYNLNKKRVAEMTNDLTARRVGATATENAPAEESEVIAEAEVVAEEAANENPADDKPAE
jgi:Na+/melibiose symporter-like transporter